MPTDHDSRPDDDASQLDRLRRRIAALEDLLTRQQAHFAQLEDRLQGKPHATFYQAAMEQLADAFFVTDLGGRILDINQQACDSLGYTREELRGMHVADIDSQAPGDGLGNRLKGRLDSNELVTARTRHKRKDGTTFPVEVRISSYGNAGQTLVLSLARDITAREHHEHQLRLRAAALENALNGFDIVSSDGLFLYANRAYLTMWGYDHMEEIVGTSPVGHCQDPGVPAKIIETLDTEGRCSIEFVAKRKDGSTFEALMSAQKFPGADGRSIYIGASLNISDRKRAERDREKLITALEEKNAELERFVYTVSHDLKTPLVTIQGFVDLIREDIETGDHAAITRSMSTIGQATDQMGKLLEQLLHIGRLGQVEMAFETVSMQNAVEAVAEAMALILDDLGVKLAVADDLPDVKGNWVRLLEVWQNLLENAVKHARTAPEAIVHVGCDRDRTPPVFYVRDNGPGVAPEYHETIFGLFQKLHADEAGSGAGLAIVKRIIERHNGQIWVESRGTGDGAAFCFTIGSKPSV